MAIITETQKEITQRLLGVSGRRMRAARCAAGVSEADASRIIGHKGATQLSLCESGQRLLPLPSMYLLADHYAVSLDYLTGRINDPISDPMEHNQGLLARSIGSSIEDVFQRLTALLSHQAVHYMRTQRDDRTDLKYLTERVKELGDAFERLKQINPSFEDDMRGGARVAGTIDSALNTAKRVSERMVQEDKRKQSLMANQAEIDMEGLSQLMFPLASAV